MPVELYNINGEARLEPITNEQWQRRRDSIEVASVAIGLDFRRVMDIVFNVAIWIHNNGNTGYSTHALASQISEHVPGILEIAPAIEGILFREHKKRSWMIRKNPHWSYKWAEKVGWDDAVSQLLITECHEKAKRENVQIEQRRARPVGVIRHEILDGWNAIQIAHRYAMAHVQLMMTTSEYERTVWNEQLDALARELVWRALMCRDEAIKRDATPWVNMDKQWTFINDAPLMYAHEFVRHNIRKFYGDEFVRQARVLPTPMWWDEIDGDAIPVPTQAREAERMNATQVIAKFWGMLQGDDPEAGIMTTADKATIVRQLKALLKNTKGDF